MGSRILLADDSITIQKVVNLTFADEGIEVVAVSNGDVALRRLGEIKPDLVLADIFMPGKNGYELCEAIKQGPGSRNMPVVLLVGAFEPFDQNEARRVRADAHLTKPFESRTLVETVRRLITASSGAVTGPIAPMPNPEEARHELAGKLNAAHAATPVSTPPPINLDLAAMFESNAASSPRTTGELASPSSQEAAAIINVAVSDWPAHEGADTTITAAVEAPASIEVPSNGDVAYVGTPSLFGLDTQEMILDLDKPEPIEPDLLAGVTSAATEESTLLDVEIGGADDVAGYFESAGEISNIEAPPQNSLWQPVAVTTPLNRQVAEFAMSDGAAFSASEASSETACATLLAVDEPLGDVLLGEAVSLESSPVADFTSNDSLDVELVDQGVSEIALTDIALTEAAPIEAPLTDTPLAEALLTDTPLADVLLSDTPLTETPLTETPLAAATEFDLVASQSQIQETPVDLAADFEEKTDLPEFEAVDRLLGGGLQSPGYDDSYAAPGTDGNSFDWTTPSAGAYSTAQLDSTVMPVDVAEYLTQDRAAAQHSESFDEPAFNAGTAWTEEEARFAPIDIEAVSVDELRSPLEPASATETGFSFSSSPVEPLSASVETPAVEAASAARPQELSATDLSPVVIEDIVRRVVSEMSNSIIREIAWEVVPDCVERVVAQLARESLAKQA